MKIDLHVHSNRSKDGLVTVEELLGKAELERVDVISITDHTSIKALLELETIEAPSRVVTIPGIEINTYDGIEIHVLGYGLDIRSPAITDLINMHDENTEYNLELIFWMLKKMGIEIEKETHSFGGRKDIAEYLVKKNAAQTISGAFATYLDGEEYAKLPLRRIDPACAIECIRSANGEAVLAHPLSLNLCDADLANTFKRLKDYGLCGIEAYYASYSSASQKKLAQLAKGLNLLQTSGSDFHGWGEGCRANFGDFRQSKEAVAASLEFLKFLKGRSLNDL